MCSNRIYIAGKCSWPENWRSAIALRVPKQTEGNRLTKYVVSSYWITVAFSAKAKVKLRQSGIATSHAHVDAMVTLATGHVRLENVPWELQKSARSHDMLCTLTSLS